MADPTPAPKLNSPYYWPTRLGLALLKLSGRLPYRVQYGLGIALGELMYRFARSRRAIAATNLRLSFPALSEAEQRRLLRENMHATGLGLIEMGTSWATPDEKLRPLTEIRGREHLDAALAAGKGAILLSFHFTSLELCGHLLARAVPVAAMYRPHPNPVFERQMRTGREASARRVIPRDDVRSTLKALKANLPLWYAADQDYGRKHSIFVPFFGIPAATITATSRFAKMTGAPVIPFTHRRLPGGRGFVLELHPPLAGIPCGDEAADALAVNRFLEDWLRRYPADYMWLHRRFKTRPEGEPTLYEPARKQRRRELSGKRYTALLARGTVLHENAGHTLSLATPEGERVRVLYRPAGWRSLLADPSKAVHAAYARLAALDLPVLPLASLRFCRAYHADVLMSSARPGLSLEQARAAGSLPASAEALLARMHAAGVDAPAHALLLDTEGACWIAEPEACRFGPAPVGPQRHSPQ